MPKVNLGRIRTVFKGEWVPGTYVIDDVVLYAGSAYTCIAIASLSNNPTDTNFWVRSSGGVEFVGVWDTSTTYKVNQIATFNGATYIAIAAHSATEPTATGQTDWTVLAGGFKFEGAWNSAIPYQVNDIVTLTGSSFIAISNHTGTQPEAAGNAAWVLYASGGDIADQTSQSGKVLKTDGTATSWGTVGVTELGIPDGTSGQFLSTDGSGTLNFAGGGGANATVFMRAHINDPERWKDGLPTLMTNPTGMVCIGNAGGDNFGTGGTGYSSCTGVTCDWTVPAGITTAQFQIWGAGAQSNTGCCCGGAPQGGHGNYLIVTKTVTPGQVYCLCAGGANQSCCCSNTDSCSGCCSFVYSDDHGGGSLSAWGGCRNIGSYFADVGHAVTDCYGSCHVYPDKDGTNCQYPGLRLCNSCGSYCHGDNSEGAGFWCGKAYPHWCLQNSIQCYDSRLGYGACIDSDWVSNGHVTDMGMIPSRGGDLWISNNKYGYQTTSAVIAPDHSYCRLNGGIHLFTSDGTWGGSCCFCGNGTPCQGALPGSGGFPSHVMGGNTNHWFGRGRNGQVVVSYK
jgi:hypothetical protein